MSWTTSLTPIVNTDGRIGHVDFGVVVRNFDLGHRLYGKAILLFGGADDFFVKLFQNGIVQGANS
jgi:hypothetical protein